MLPPNTFRAGEVKFDRSGGRGGGAPRQSASAGLLLATATPSCNAEGGGNVFLQPGDIVAAWTEAPAAAEICPYAAATVQMPNDQQGWKEPRSTSELGILEISGKFQKYDENEKRSLFQRYFVSTF